MKTWATIGRALRDEQSCAMVSIVDAKGSAPREAGARMVVLEDGSFAGTIGGGTLEWQAIERAREALAKGGASGDVPPVGLSRMALGPDLGQCCGGSVRILLEVFTPDRSAEVQALADAEKGRTLRHRGPHHRAAAWSGPSWIAIFRVARTACWRPTGATGALRDPKAGSGADRRRPCRARLDLALAPLDFSVVWIDPRKDDVSLHRARRRAGRGGGGTGGRAGCGARRRLRAGDVAQPRARLRRRARRAQGQAVRLRRPDRLGVEEGPLHQPHAAGGPGGRRYRAAGLPHRHRRRIASKQPAVIAASVVADLLRRRDAMAAGRTSAEDSS